MIIVLLFTCAQIERDGKLIEEGNRKIKKGTRMSLEDYVNNPLWPLLVETVHAMIMYPQHKAYVRDVFLHEQPDATAQELAIKLGIPLGEALVIFYELQKQKSEESPEGEKASDT